jgi:hypothetical protein
MTLARAIVQPPGQSRPVMPQTKLPERRCACGGVIGSTGECTACKARRLVREAERQRRMSAHDRIAPGSGGPNDRSVGRMIINDPARDVWITPRPRAAVSAMSGRAMEQMDGEGEDDVDPGVLAAANGQTWCALPGGTPRTTVSNTMCSRTCTERHEGVHRTDISTCCAAAGVAYGAATTDAARAAVSASFAGWVNANRVWTECHAYTTSVSCADGELTLKKCGTPQMAPADAACCTHLDSYRSSMETKRATNCASAPATSTACPFP